jgi:hypothetical protein
MNRDSDNSVKVVKCLDVATFSCIFHLEMSELISCVEIHTCMHIVDTVMFKAYSSLSVMLRCCSLGCCVQHGELAIR